MSDQTIESIEGEKAGQESANGSGAEKMFSQDEVNKMIKGKSDRELQKMLNEVGFQSVDELKALVKQKKDRDESEKTELQKAIEKATQLEKERESWQSKQKETAAQYDVALKAAKLGIVDPDAAWKLLDKSMLEYDKDDSPTNTEQLLQGLLKDKPYLAGGGSSAANPGKSRDETDPFIRALLKDLPEKKR